MTPSRTHAPARGSRSARVHWATCLAGFCLFAGPTTFAAAQTTPPPTDAATSDAEVSGIVAPHRVPRSGFPEWALISSAGVIASAALFPVDPTVRRWLRSDELQTSGALRGAMSATNVLGSSAPPVAALGLAAIAWGTGSDRLLDASLHTAEALVATGLVVTTIKGLAGRTRPHASPSDHMEFSLGAGFRGGKGRHRSYPSGHTSGAFALASVLALELEDLGVPRRRLVKAVLFGAATLTGTARIYRERHWASDVALGAAIGVAVGRAIHRLNHHRPAGVRSLALTPMVDTTLEGSLALGLTLRH